MTECPAEVCAMLLCEDGTSAHRVLRMTDSMGLPRGDLKFLIPLCRTHAEVADENKRED